MMGQCWKGRRVDLHLQLHVKMNASGSNSPFTCLGSTEQQRAHVLLHRRSRILRMYLDVGETPRGPMHHHQCRLSYTSTFPRHQHGHHFEPTQCASRLEPLP